MSTVVGKLKPEPRLRVRPSQPRLDSWKEIAVYLRRDVRTVQRWERSEGLPVRRVFHRKASSVYAVVTELDSWLASRCPVTPELSRTKRLNVCICQASLRLGGQVNTRRPNGRENGAEIPTRPESCGNPPSEASSNKPRVSWSPKTSPAIEDQLRLMSFYVACHPINQRLVFTQIQECLKFLHSRSVVYVWRAESVQGDALKEKKYGGRAN